MDLMGLQPRNEPIVAPTMDPLIARMAEFFQAKGLVALKEEDRHDAWYVDWIEYQARHQIYASLLSPHRYSSLGHRWDVLRYTRFIEAFTYFSPAHAYNLHVSLLGLTPILLSSNEALKQDAVALLERGGVFAFGISEQTHGADLLATEFTVAPAREGRFIANGSKYYIGNCNAAAMITILAKRVDTPGATALKRAPLVLFALRPGSAAFRNLRKIYTVGIRSAYVGAFDVVDYEFPATDIICPDSARLSRSLGRGHDAWDTTFATINVGKMMLGVGICQRAMEEATAHLRRRVLFGRPVSEMPHLRLLTARAFARLAGMRLYANRALDYFAVAHAGDRRDLLFNAVQKAKVGSEGVAVVEMLSECIGAKGFEGQTYFESALRDIRLIPALEGSTHINFSAAAAYLRDYFAEPPADLPEVPTLTLRSPESSDEIPLTTFGSGRPGEVVFAHYLRAYQPFSGIANVCLFAAMVTAFRDLFLHRLPAWSARLDLDISVAVGRCGAVIVYGQLIAERASFEQAPPRLISVIFHQLILSLSSEVTALALLPRFEQLRDRLLAPFNHLPATTAADFAFVADNLSRDGKPPRAQMP